MESIDVLDYARRLYQARGDKAEAEAAQKAVSLETAGDNQQAQVWRRIRTAIADVRSPHVS